MQSENKLSPSWLDRPLFDKINLNWETLIFLIILVLAVFSRFYDLESRVMSHDENTHVYYSWRFSRGEGLAHDPLMHGPFQFHLIALSYFMFGDNDFTARIPAVLFSIATVAFMWYYRRFLGRAGAIVGAVLFLISPYILYYGRYVRNEVFSAFFGVVGIWAILRYLQSGNKRCAYLLTAVTVLHFTAKETAFIYQAQALLFLGFYFIWRITQANWERPNMRMAFVASLLIAVLLLGGAALSELAAGTPETLNAAETAQPSVPGEEMAHLPASGPPALLLILGILGVLALLTTAYFLLRGFGWQRLRAERSFGLLILLGTMVLPQLAPFPVRWVGWTIPTNASQVMALTMTDILRIAAWVAPLLILSIALGVAWNWREWLINAAIFYGLFTIFYTSVFTNGAGFFTGLVGSLGYWLEQQGVQRGSQPSYYYWAVQVPVYEYLPLLGTILASWLALAGVLSKRPEAQTAPETADLAAEPVETELPPQEEVFESVVRVEDGEPEELEVSLPAEPAQEDVPTFPLLLFWTVTAFIAYTIAGEKMPWLTVHITTPMILTSAWGLGILIDSVDWAAFRQRRGWLILILLPLFLISLAALIASIFGPNPPFQGKELSQLQATSNFIVSLIVMAVSGLGIYISRKQFETLHTGRVFVLVAFAFMAFLTARTAIQATYINYDNANELLVYAHSAGGVKVAMDQIEEISERITDGNTIEIAYDNETSYPYWWYLRNYPNARFYGSDPTRSLRDVPAILVGDANFGKIEPVVADTFYQFDYIRLWWPNQDYFGLTWERISNAIFDRQMRAAIFQIWLNRDYTRYGELTGRDFSLPNWSPSARMQLYIRKDIVSQLWNYGAAPSPDLLKPGLWDDKEIKLVASGSIGEPGAAPGQFQNPRDLAVAPDGSLYVVDSDNHRIQHLSPEGEVLHAWGGYGDLSIGDAPGGRFNQPWGIALGPDGSVYVADTWNHRIQKFSPEGDFILMWGFFGQAEQPAAFWGPRDVAVDSLGRVFVTDTGNKRVVVFSGDGEFIGEFGGTGMSPGQFDEPVGIVVDDQGRIYVADTWNQRIQVMVQVEDNTFQPEKYWDVAAWYGQSLENKPYLAVDGQGRVFASDPDGYRILVFDNEGQALFFWGDFGVGLDAFGLPASVAVGPEGVVWVSDSRNSRILRFDLPEP